MKTAVVMMSLTIFLVTYSEGAKKKSVYKLPWEGFPFQRPPTGFLPPSLPEEPEYYENYELGEAEFDEDPEDVPDEKPDYKSSGAFTAEIASALHDFTFDLLAAMEENKTGDENIVISPLSVYTAISMLTLGLGGNSKSQAMSVLHGDAFGDMHQEMSELSDAVFENNRRNVTLTKANRIFIDRSIRLLKDFKRSMKRDYHVSAKKVNFMQAPGMNRKRINQFVQKHTNQKIRNLAPAGSVTSETKLFIVNAMHMKAFWRTPFSNTNREKFFISPGERTTATLMSTIGPCSFEIDNSLKAQLVRNQLKGDVSMVMIVPDVPGDFSALEGGRGKERIRRAIETLYASSAPHGWMPSCQISMPKFKIEHSADDLIDCMKKMGMSDVFDPSTADFSRMSPTHQGLYVSDMRHKAAIEVNEQGIEGAAATSIVVTARMMPQMVYINRPFLFIVRDDKTGATLFTGKVVRPAYD